MSSTPPPPRPKGPAGQDSPDAAMDRYLASVDLRGLDIDDALLAEARSTGGFGLGLGVALWAALLAGVVAVPNTLFYQLHPMAEGLYIGLWLLLSALTVALLRGVATWLAALPWGRSLDLMQRPGPTWSLGISLSPKAQRQTLAGAIVALAAVLVLVLPRDVQWQGQGYTGGWFLATATAVVTGILVGRFIIAHAAARPARAPGPPIVLPTWWRWVTLGWISAGAVAVLTAHSCTVAGDTSNEFTLAGAGLFLGISGAIWLARRFDELEAKWQKEARLRQHSSESDP